VAEVTVVVQGGVELAVVGIILTDGIDVYPYGIGPDTLAEERFAVGERDGVASENSNFFASRKMSHEQLGYMDGVEEPKEMLDPARIRFIIFVVSSGGSDLFESAIVRSESTSCGR
jgi:hypothetical protein